MKNRINFKLFVVVTLLTAIPVASYAGGRNSRPVKKKSANATLPGVAKSRENWEKWTKIPFIGIDNKESAAYARGNKNIEKIQVERANEICRQMPGTRY